MTKLTRLVSLSLDSDDEICGHIVTFDDREIDVKFIIDGGPDEIQVVNSLPPVLGNGFVTTAHEVHAIVGAVLAFQAASREGEAVVITADELMQQHEAKNDPET